MGCEPIRWNILQNRNQDVSVYYHIYLRLFMFKYVAEIRQRTGLTGKK